ncbi:MAG: alpha/beta fold hydrolase [Candidatus Obscuribacterales bacterium]|nr:alpha/beta fold hydrolase [Candidatus Obscuribacterales bacterium]
MAALSAIKKQATDSKSASSTGVLPGNLTPSTKESSLSTSKEKSDKNSSQSSAIDSQAKPDSDNGKEKCKKTEKGKVRGDAPCISWIQPGVPTKAVLLCVHGLGLDSSCYQALGSDMSKLGIATYAIDVRGFGSWMKAQGHKKVDFSDCIDDVEDTLLWLRKTNPKKPVFLLGESMGGAIVLHATAQYPHLVDGVISAAASGDRFKQKKTDLKVFLHALTGPTRSFDIGKDIVDQAAGDNETLKKLWEGDELARLKLSPLELMQFQHFMNETNDVVEKINSTPVLMVQGSKDGLVKPEGTQELFEKIKSSDKEMVMVSNGEHLIFEHDQFSNQTLAGVAKWILKHCPQSTPYNDLLESARAKIEAGKAPLALNDLKQAMTINPNDPNLHLLHGKAQLMLNRPVLARKSLTTAMRLGRGTEVAQEANYTLLKIPNQMIPANPKLSRMMPAAAASNALPTVLVFSAKWCEPCKNMDKLVEEAKLRCGNRVIFQTVDVDDPANEQLVEKYSIGPVPTTVFLNPNGDVASSQVGYGGPEAMATGLRKLIGKI